MPQLSVSCHSCLFSPLLYSFFPPPGPQNYYYFIVPFALTLSLFTILICPFYPLPLPPCPSPLLNSFPLLRSPTRRTCSSTVSASPTCYSRFPKTGLDPFLSLFPFYLVFTIYNSTVLFNYSLIKCKSNPFPLTC